MANFYSFTTCNKLIMPCLENVLIIIGSIAFHQSLTKCWEYERFAETVLTRYHQKVNYWMTFNEINSAFHFPALSQGLVKSNGDPIVNFLVVTC
jgi:beta-glucosidase/6-phospho-beta-glucosidase/beta-galactosidase